MRVHKKGLLDGLSEPPRHVVVVSRFSVEGYLLINQPDVFGGHPEGARGVLQCGGDWLQVIDGLELNVQHAEFRSRRGFKREFSPSLEVVGMSLG